MQNLTESTNYYKKNYSKIAIFIVLIIIIGTSINQKLWEKDNRVISWDAISYYAYLPATFIYHDLSLKFIKDYHGSHKFIFWPQKLKNGNFCIKTSMGISFMYLPFFALAHLYTLHSKYDAGGFSFPYKIGLIVGSIFWFFISLLILRKLLIKFFSDKIAAITILLIGLGTNIFYYVIFEPVMSHQFNFLLFSAFIYTSISWYEKRTILKSIILGIIFGFISLIRPSDSIIIIFFIFYGITNLEDIKQRFIIFYKNYYLLFIIVFFSFVIWIPQFLYWKNVSGHFLFYSYNNEGFFWNNPHFIKGLIGYRKGWLLYTPLMIFSLIGIVFLRKKLKVFLLPILIFLPLNCYIIFSWWSWWYGGSFGMRPMIESYALLSIPLAAFIAWVLEQKKIKKTILLFFIIIFASFNLFETAQYYYGAIHWDSMTKKAYWNSFGRLHPSKKFKYLIKSPNYKAAIKGIDENK